MAINNLMRVSRSHNIFLKKFAHRQLSVFADFKNIVGDYDKYRKPVGSELMLGMTEFYTNKKAKINLHILDAGCGTGIYTRSIFDMGVGQMALLDASSDMLNVAREKLAAELDANKVSSIVQNSLPEIPFGDGTFDGVLLNAVLPHLPRGDGNFSGAVETLKEARRVLQPDGVISITESLDSSLTNAWCLNISPEIANKFCPILPSVEEWNKIFYEAGLKCLVRTNLLGFGLFSDEDYFDDTNIFKQEWLNSSVYYEPATKEEIERMRQKVKTLQTRGEIKEWIKDHDQTEKFGFMTLFICQ